jgi:hypothetical protein
MIPPHERPRYEIDPLTGKITTLDAEIAVAIAKRIARDAEAAPPPVASKQTRRRTARDASSGNGSGAIGLADFGTEIRELLEAIGRHRRITLDEIKAASPELDLRGLFGGLAKRLGMLRIDTSEVYTRTKRGRTVAYDAGPLLLKWMREEGARTP